MIKYIKNKDCFVLFLFHVIELSWIQFGFEKQWAIYINYDEGLSFNMNIFGHCFSFRIGKNQWNKNIYEIKTIL